MAMIGADSRLGECYMTGRPDGKYDIWPTEGGHTEFTPRTELEVEMFLHLKKALGASNRISIWRVVSWWGLYNVYSFLRAKYPEKVSCRGLCAMRGGVGCCWREWRWCFCRMDHTVSAFNSHL